MIPEPPVTPLEKWVVRVAYAGYSAAAIYVLFCYLYYVVLK